MNKTLTLFFLIIYFFSLGQNPSEYKKEFIIPYLEEDQDKSLDYFNKATRAYYKQDYFTAFKYYTKAYQYSTYTVYNYVFYAGVCLVEAERYDEASNYFELILKEGFTDLNQSEQSQLYSLLTQIHAKQGRPNRALHLIQEAKARNPNNLNLLKAEAIAYQIKNDTINFVKTLKAISLLNADKSASSNANYNLGVIYQERQRHDIAKRYYHKAVKHDKRNADAYLNLASLIIEKDEEYTSKMNGLGISDEDNKRYDKLLKQRQQNLKKAIPYLKKYLKYNPNDNAVKNQLISIYELTNNSKKTQQLKKT